MPPWRREHDKPGTSTEVNIWYPTNLQDLIGYCQGARHLKGAGSHWALSNAAMSDDVFVETHDPNDVENSMGQTLFDVVPECLDAQFVGAMAARRPSEFGGQFAHLFVDESFYLVHIETGKRI